MRRLMRIWDIHPGYLNRNSLLGEHRELHGIVSIIRNDKRGYSSHPETLRWVGHGWALRQRHRLLVTEMALRGYQDKTPVRTYSNKFRWPEIYIDMPHHQFHLLNDKYINKDKGRIPIPVTAQQLWSQHKYSVLARDTALYKYYGKVVSRMRRNTDYSTLVNELTEILRQTPDDGRIRNTLLHMWGYVSDGHTGGKRDIETWSSRKLLRVIQQLVISSNEPYLLSSTALSDLMAWL